MAEGEYDDMDCEWLGDYMVSILKSPTWSTPVARFIDENCDLFDDSEENRLEYTECHNDFRLLVTDLFTAHLAEVSVTPEQFEWFLTHGLSQHQQLHRALIEQLLSVDDFLTFKAMMAKHNAELDRKALRTLNAGEHDEPTSPTHVVDEVASGAVTNCINRSAEEVVGSGWQMYQDDDLKRIMEQSAHDEESRQANMRCEEAQLEQAIAMSLQVEEERLKLFEEFPSVNDPAQEEVQVVWSAPGFVSMPVVPRLPADSAGSEQEVEEQGQWVPPSAGFVSMPFQPHYAEQHVEESAEPAEQQVHQPWVPPNAGFVSMPYSHHISQEAEGMEAMEPVAAHQAPFLPPSAGFVSMPYNQCVYSHDEQASPMPDHNLASFEPQEMAPIRVPRKAGFVSMPYCHRAAPRLEPQQEVIAEHVPDLVMVAPMAAAAAVPAPLPPGVGFTSAPLMARLPGREPMSPGLAPQQEPEVFAPPLPDPASAMLAQEVPEPAGAAPMFPAEAAPPQVKEEAVMEMRQTLSVQRERAARAMDTPSVVPPLSQGQSRRRQFRSSQAPAPAPAPAPVVSPTGVSVPVPRRTAPQAPSGPTEEERQKRAEHLKRQRDRLIQKRNEDRDRAVATYQQTRPVNSSGIDASVIRENRAPQNKRMVAELTGTAQAAPAAQAVQPAPELMRQALTRQLRQTLARSSVGAGLNSQLNTLERRRYS